MTFVLNKRFLTEPKQLVKLIILLICVVFTIYQLAECIKKIVHPPVSTHYNFYLNDTIKYPCLTICRRPAYKTDLYPKYGLRSSTLLNSQNAFLNFDFENYTIQEFVEDTTYDFDEVFGQYGYAGVGSNPNLTITSYYHLMRGLCHTLIPEIQSDTFSISGGYFLYLRHNSSTRDIDEYGVSKSGFQIYLHDPNEILSFEDDQTDSFLEFLYLEASEDMNVVLNVQTYGRISNKDHPCVTDLDYSKSKCQEYCVHMQVATTAGCTLPWLLLSENSSFPQCSDFTSVRDLIADLRKNGFDLSEPILLVTIEARQILSYQVLYYKEIRSTNHTIQLLWQTELEIQVVNYGRGPQLQHIASAMNDIFMTATYSGGRAHHKLFTNVSRALYLKNCHCLMSCNITVYSTKIVNRREMDELNAPNSIISLYYSTNVVTKLNEVIGYDWNQFLSDIGGSLGFLLGLSVIGLISMIEQICQILFRWMFAKKLKRKEEERQKEQLNKKNKDPEPEDANAETSGGDKEATEGKDCGKPDHSYNNLRDYFTDYSYYEKNLVDKAHDKNNKY